jgi:type I restriction enzyme, S subunit
VELTDNDKPFDIPENWVWVLLKDVSIKIHYGYTASAEVIGNTKLLRITDIQDDAVDWGKVPFCVINEDQLNSYRLKNKDIVIARTGGTIGKTYLISNLFDVAVFASYLIRIIPSECISEKYLKYFMDSDLYWKQLTEKSQGTGQPNVNGESLKKLLLPLPPLSEQNRIIERLERVLPEIGKLHTDEFKLDVLQRAFP